MGTGAGWGGREAAARGSEQPRQPKCVWDTGWEGTVPTQFLACWPCTLPPPQGGTEGSFSMKSVQMGIV